MKVNMKKVAEEAGVSVSTVSRVVSGFKNVKKSTRKKVLGVIKDLNYEADFVARSLKKMKTNIIGLLLGNVLSQFYL